MKKGCMVGCLSIIGIFVLLIIIGAIVGNNENSSKNIDKSVESVIDVNQFSRISSSELVETA